MRFSRTRLSHQLSRAVVAEDWYAVLQASERLLAIEPKHPGALSAKCRAWAAVGLSRTSTGADVPLAIRQSTTAGSRRSNAKSAAVRKGTAKNQEPRFVLWVDAVGGYLVCLDNEIVLGPPTPDGGADVPILADISRRHAVIRRDREGYSIEAIRSLKLNGHPLEGAASLADGDLFELGEGVEIRFRRPHALSLTARLELVSHHRIEPSVDAVLLMAESCVLGPKRDAHIVCRDWPGEMALFRQGKNLVCRSDGDFEIDGQLCQGKREIGMGSRITGGGFSFSLEPKC